MGPVAFHVFLWFSPVRYYYHCLSDEKKGIRKGEGSSKGYIASEVEANRCSRLREKCEGMDRGKHRTGIQNSK